MVADADVMALTGAESPAGEDANAGGKNRKKIIMLVVLLAVGGFAAKTFLLKSAPTEVVKPVEGEVLDVGVLTVNLPGTATSYARVGLAAVLVEGADAAQFGAKLALLKDAGITAIAGYSGEVLRTPRGQDKLREELTKEAEQIYGGEVLRVVFTEFVIQ